MGSDGRPPHCHEHASAAQSVSFVMPRMTVFPASELKLRRKLKIGYGKLLGRLKYRRCVVMAAECQAQAQRLQTAEREVTAVVINIAYTLRCRYQAVCNTISGEPLTITLPPSRSTLPRQNQTTRVTPGSIFSNFIVISLHIFFCNSSLSATRSLLSTGDG